MDYCYACKKEMTATSGPDMTLPGLCDSCRHRTREVMDLLTCLEPERFPREYFVQEDVDPPVWKEDALCVHCGVVSQCFGWTQWRRVAHDGGADPGKRESIEGDAYLFCANCREITADPWKEQAKQVSTDVMPVSWHDTDHDYPRRIPDRPHRPDPGKPLSRLYMLVALAFALVALAVSL